MIKAFQAALFAALVLSACSSANSRAARERNPAPCPNIVVLDDAARMVDFNGDQELANVAWSAEIERADLVCRYYGDRPIEASIEIELAFGRGPAAEEKKRNFSYFVAVTRTDREVIAKEVFAREVSFDSSEPIKRVKERIDEITIPRADESIAGNNFEVVIGLALTREQVIYNRSGKSLKFPEL